MKKDSRAEKTSVLQEIFVEVKQKVGYGFTTNSILPYLKLRYGKRCPDENFLRSLLQE